MKKRCCRNCTLMNQPSDWESKWLQWVHNRHVIKFHMLHVTIRCIPQVSTGPFLDIIHYIYGIHLSMFSRDNLLFFRSCWLCDACREISMTFVWECLNAMNSLTRCWLAVFSSQIATVMLWKKKVSSVRNPMKFGWHLPPQTLGEGGEVGYLSLLVSGHSSFPNMSYLVCNPTTLDLGPIEA